MKPYDITNWYWTVAGDQTKAFSSKTGDYVPAADATFVAWRADGTGPTAIDTELNLGAVLAPALLRPTNTAVLDGYTSTHADTLLAQVIFKILFNHENRIRALEAKAPITVAQARATIKALM